MSSLLDCHIKFKLQAHFKVYKFNNVFGNFVVIVIVIIACK